jgi:peptidyl-prolyl cis-trans isomerase A (cyclophilin A)|eukprot:CAMPEP_0181230850 /NCGR_PEP_ID=MMETSP1096-20121128/34730_1 /TAXON_ID=156174 ORGANISM="Chrysochromulina ericina, Strain CCMP281" /NCGR_SAMPLE_ID=MMETSP1096 /ASSEMBLY_ACC=CAM_ASM_000453 /LENGTH=205 /DNA_ID=CAMNT_0023324727 /DNA_START=63 /DNA_END=680 /DNA_ORIENTATION=-
MNFLDDMKKSAASQFVSQDYPPAAVEPKTTRVKFVTSAGDFTVEVDRALSPAGVDRFLQLVNSGFFDGQLLYRVISGFLVQFGVAVDPGVMAQWDSAPLPDEPNRALFRRGTLSYAGSGPDSRTCHMFVSLDSLGRLGGADHEATLGWVDEADLFVIEQIVRNYGMTGYKDTGSLQPALIESGNAAAAEFPGLDYIIRAEEEWSF